MAASLRLTRSGATAIPRLALGSLPERESPAVFIAGPQLALGGVKFRQRLLDQLNDWKDFRHG